MHVRFLLGPAGSGKTFRCLEAIRGALRRSPEGEPLVFLAPKQATFQLERQLLADLPGYSRLHILSFERLARFVFDRVDPSLPTLLNEEGRVMVLRSLLGHHRNELNLFRASSRLPGFARQLSHVLRELQQYHLGPERLESVAETVGGAHRLDDKLRDLAFMQRAVTEWLHTHELQDADALLDLATEALRGAGKGSSLAIGGLWLDGFAQMTVQERQLLTALLPFCREATLAFCLDALPENPFPWYSPWALLSQTFRQCHTAIEALPGVTVERVLLPRDAGHNRFAGNPVLEHLEKHWALPQPMAMPDSQDNPAARTIRVQACPDPEAEAKSAAREILKFVRGGGRFREVAVLVRSLEPYHDVVTRMFTRYQIPFFLDRRESVSHHPLAELTRCALRTIAFRWRREDWFGALKTGLTGVVQEEIDELENRALEHGWEGSAWFRDLEFEADAAVVQHANRLRVRLVEPFRALEQAIGDQPNGKALAQGIRAFWDAFGVGDILERWSAPGPEDHPIHRTVWEQMHDWLDNLALAFPEVGETIPEWLPVLDAGLAGLTVGVIPPVLDHVLVGAIDRSRNPDLKRVILMGANETLFPAVPAPSMLLTDHDRERMEHAGSGMGPGHRLQLGHERFYGYIACTRARDQVLLTYAMRDAGGRALNPSPFVKHLQRLFPWVTVEHPPTATPWPEAQHPNELIAPLLANRPGQCPQPDPALNALSELPPFHGLLDRVAHLEVSLHAPSIDATLPEKLFGKSLNTSVSKIEQFGDCAFRFFTDSGLRLEERKTFELDHRLQGSFQHAVLEGFHQSVSDEKRQWRDLNVAEARQRIAAVADRLRPTFHGGVMEANGRNRFLAESCKRTLQNFIEVIIRWMTQYTFDPVAVEVGFGFPGQLPAWEIPLQEGRQLRLRGFIDRVDLLRDPENPGRAWCVVLDYKSTTRKPDRVLLHHGIQQQLPAYLNVLWHLENPREPFGVNELVPAGVFFVPLRGSFKPGAHRSAVLEHRDQAVRQAYTHQGILDHDRLRDFDNRPGQIRGDQFPYWLKNDGTSRASSFCALGSETFRGVLEHQEHQLIRMGNAIYQGDVSVNPWKKGTEKACDRCPYASICRIDAWTHAYRTLRMEGNTRQRQS